MSEPTELDFRLFILTDSLMHGTLTVAEFIDAVKELVVEDEYKTLFESISGS